MQLACDNLRFADIRHYVHDMGISKEELMSQCGKINKFFNRIEDGVDWVLGIVFMLRSSCLRSSNIWEETCPYMVARCDRIALTSPVRELLLRLRSAAK